MCRRVQTDAPFPFLLSSLVYMLLLKTRPRLVACRTATLANPRAFQTLKPGFVLCFSAATKWRRFILRRAVLCPRAVSGVESTAASQRGLSCISSSSSSSRRKKKRRNALFTCRAGSAVNFVPSLVKLAHSKQISQIMISTHPHLPLTSFFLNTRYVYGLLLHQQLPEVNKDKKIVCLLFAYQPRPFFFYFYFPSSVSCKSTQRVRVSSLCLYCIFHV